MRPEETPGRKLLDFRKVVMGSWRTSRQYTDRERQIPKGLAMVQGLSM
jgi:hypothetical protein